MHYRHSLSLTNPEGKPQRACKTSRAIKKRTGKNHPETWILIHVLELVKSSKTNGKMAHHNCNREVTNLFIVVNNAHAFEGHKTAVGVAVHHLPTHFLFQIHILSKSNLSWVASLYWPYRSSVQHEMMPIDSQQFKYDMYWAPLYRCKREREQNNLICETCISDSIAHKTWTCREEFECTLILGRACDCALARDAIRSACSFSCITSAS